MYKVLVFIFLVSCAQTADVFRHKDGYYSVTGLASDKSESIAIALRSSKKHCEAKKQEPVIQDQKTTYHGRYSETTNKDIKTAAEIGAILTGDYAGFGQAGKAARGDENYKTVLKFTCSK